MDALKKTLAAMEVLQKVTEKQHSIGAPKDVLNGLEGAMDALKDIKKGYVASLKEITESQAQNVQESLAMRDEIERLLKEQDQLKHQIEKLSRRLGLTSMHSSAILPSEHLAKRALRTLSIKQHAILQLILAQHTNTQIAERLGVTEGAVKPLFNALKKRLLVTDRMSMSKVYEPILENTSKSDYLKRYGIDRDWASKYGKLSATEAITRDPLYNAMAIERARPTKEMLAEIDDIMSAFKAYSTKH